MYHINGFSADVRNGEWQITQRLDRISIYSLEGELSAALEQFTKELEDFSSYYLNGKVSIRVRNCPPFDYVYHEVTFDKIVLRVGPDGEGQDELQVLGIRKPVVEEFNWLESYAKQQSDEAKEHRRKQLEALKKEFENE